MSHEFAFALYVEMGNVSVLRRIEREGNSKEPEISEGKSRARNFSTLN